MNSIIDVMRREAIETREVILYPEGIFYRAYGFSALRFIRWLRPYRVKKRFYKNLGAEVCYVGFPQAALDALLPEGFRAEATAEGWVVVRGPFGALTQQDYDEWVRGTPLSLAKPRSPTSANADDADGADGVLLGGNAPGGNAPGGALLGNNGMLATDETNPGPSLHPESDSGGAAEREVLHRLHGFALEAATPLECMIFLSELKKKLVGA